MKTTKRILAVLMAVMLIFALSVTSVSAVGTATLTVTSNEFAGGELGTKDVTIVQMFKKTGNTYELANNWKPFFASGILEGVTDANDPTLPTKAFEYVATLSTDNAKVAFAKAAKDYYNDNTASFPTTLGETETGFTATTNTVAAVDGTATFSNLDDGYYLVLPESGSTDDRGTDAILVNVVAGAENTVAIKSVYPTVDKTVSTDGTNFTDDTAAGVGDTVTFQLSSTVPDMTEYEHYLFKFVDTMSAGLTYADSLTVVIGSETMVVDTNYTVTTPTAANNNTLTVDLGDLKTLIAGNANINEGDAIVVTYQAKLNDNAFATGSGTNEVYVDYSHDPSDYTDTEPSTTDITTVYVYDLVIDKYDGETDAKLAGAVFEISATTNGDAIPLVTTTTANTYRVATTGEIADGNTITQVVTPSTGLITILGLDEGTYYVREVDPPLGYNGIDSPIQVDIDGDTTTGTVTYTVGSTEQADHTVRVANHAGVTLPTTGSVGTIIFTVIGVGVIIAGVMFTSRKKKENE